MIRPIFDVHLHQPVGNFDSVFEQHLADVHRALQERLAERGFLPVVLHLSAPLPEWFETHGARTLDQLGRLAADGRIELLAAGMYAPVLAARGKPLAGEVDYAGPMETSAPPAAPARGYEIFTVAKSEKNLKPTIQARSVTARRAVATAGARLSIHTAPRS